MKFITQIFLNLDTQIVLIVMDDVRHCQKPRILKRNGIYFSRVKNEQVMLLVFIFRSSNTVVSNHFHSIKILLFSSARSRDFDGLIGTELPVSMYTTETPIDMYRFNVRSSN